MLPRTLQRQLRKLGARQDAPPTLEQWQAFLSEMRRILDDLEQDRALVQRASVIASREMRELTDSLAERNDQLQREIAERERIEAELRTAKEMAESSNAMKNMFLANMSHEIRTPMTAIVGYTEILAEPVEGPEADATRGETIATIRRNAEHLVNLINDILDVSRIEADKLSVEQIPASPAELLTDVVGLMAERAGPKGLDLRLEYDTPIPQTIHTDPTRLRQILTNLLSNAIKFTDEGSVVLRTALEHHEGAPRLRADVIDTGPGIPADQLERIFDAFTQADGTMARRYGGSGLGLRIAASLAELLGGRIGVSSEPGAGSRFTVTIDPGDLTDVPMIEPDGRCNTCLEPRERAAPPARPAGDLTGVSVLVVEDAADNQRLIGYLLSRIGARLTYAENGAVALEKVVAAVDSGAPFQLILMDMQMPELDGYAATARLRESGCAVPIIALTAHAMVGERERCLEAGCDDYLTKPIDREGLIAACLAWAQRDGASADTRAA